MMMIAIAAVAIAIATAIATATVMTMMNKSILRTAAYIGLSLLLADVATAQAPQTVQPPQTPRTLVQPPPPNSSAVYPGTQQFTAGARRPARAGAQTNDVTLNFPNADVHEVAKAILGDILGVNYAVDPLVQGTVTVETAQPVARRDVLPIFEEALRASKLALVKQGDVYTVVALDKAQRQP